MTQNVHDLAAELKTATKALQELQLAYDAESWDVQNPPFAKLRHVCLHVGITAGRIAAFCEPQDHADHNSAQHNLSDDQQVMLKAAADLMYHAAQIAEVMQYDLGECVVKRFKMNAEKFSPDSEFTKLKI